MEHFFELVEKQLVADGTMAFIFDTGAEPLDFKPGQYMDYTLINPPTTDAEGDTRTFSLVNIPGHHRIELTTRLRDTAFKNNLKNLPLGSKIKAKGPMGQFTLHKDVAKPAVFLVGGIGITPFMSILRTLHQNADPRPIYLFYSNAKKSQTAFLAELTDLAAGNPHFHFVPTLTDDIPADWTAETGRIDAAMIKRHLPALEDAIFYSAGPPMMVKAMVELCEDLGISDERIRAEDFAGY